MPYRTIGRRGFLRGSAALIGGQTVARAIPATGKPQNGIAMAQREAATTAPATITLPPQPPLREALRENPPPSLPDVELAAVHSDATVDFPERHRMQTREEFRAAVAELRKQYEPFLADYTPPAPDTRARVELDTFQFRMEEPEDLRDISRVWRGEASWQEVRLPDYRGPVGWCGPRVKVPL